MNILKRFGILLLYIVIATVFYFCGTVIRAAAQYGSWNNNGNQVVLTAEKVIEFEDLDEARNYCERHGWNCTEDYVIDDIRISDPIIFKTVINDKDFFNIVKYDYTNDNKTATTLFYLDKNNEWISINQSTYESKKEIISMLEYYGKSYNDVGTNIHIQSWVGEKESYRIWRYGDYIDIDFSSREEALEYAKENYGLERFTIDKSSSGEWVLYDELKGVAGIRLNEFIEYFIENKFKSFSTYLQAYNETINSDLITQYTIIQGVFVDGLTDDKYYIKNNFPVEHVDGVYESGFIRE